jgi:carboxymethylenebutenolidase
MNKRQVNIKTRDGEASCHYFVPADDAPAVIVYTDVYGVRPSLIEMSERLALHGYRVLLPDLYYRSGPRKPFNSPAGFKDDAEKQRFFVLMKQMTSKGVMDDTQSFREFLKVDSNSKAGCVGYCMGGPLVLWAAGTFPDQIAAAASFHGARLATDQPDSPHLLASEMKGTIYIGAAAVDNSFPPEQQQRLESAFKAANVKYTLEVYPNTKHGFAVTDNPVFDPAAAQVHWLRLFDLLRKALRAD